MIDQERLKEIVREAGRIALGQWPGAGHRVESWEKTPGVPVCAADIEVDGFLKRELGALLPAAGWLSEETVDHPERLAKGLCWLVDPIDGTRDFLRGRSGWAVSVALVSNARPLIGMLAASARGEEWFGVAGQGSWRNGERLAASTRTEFPGAARPRRQPAARGPGSGDGRQAQFDRAPGSRWSRRPRPIWSPHCAGASSGTSPPRP